MKTNRRNTHAIKYMMDEISSSEDFITASPEKVNIYLTSKGVKLAELDRRMDQFLGRLGRKIAMAQAARQRPSTEQVESRRAELAKLSDAQILAKLVAKYGSQENIPMAARTKGVLSRKELESLYLDAGD
jgi:hypothetical protein